MFSDGGARCSHQTAHVPCVATCCSTSWAPAPRWTSGPSTSEGSSPAARSLGTRRRLLRRRPRSRRRHSHSRMQAAAAAQAVQAVGLTTRASWTLTTRTDACALASRSRRSSSCARATSSAPCPSGTSRCGRRGLQPAFGAHACMPAPVPTWQRRRAGQQWRWRPAALARCARRTRARNAARVSAFESFGANHRRAQTSARLHCRRTRSRTRACRLHSTRRSGHSSGCRRGGASAAPRPTAPAPGSAARRRSSPRTAGSSAVSLHALHSPPSSSTPPHPTHHMPRARVFCCCCCARPSWRAAHHMATHAWYGFRPAEEPGGCHRHGIAQLDDGADGGARGARRLLRGRGRRTCAPPCCRPNARQE